MHDLDSRIIYRTVILEDAAFTLIISETDEGFLGEWFCESCCIFGYSDLIAESLESALNAAKLSAENHQQSKHACAFAC